MSPISILTEYFLGQISGRYRRPTKIPSFQETNTFGLADQLLCLPDVTPNFKQIISEHIKGLRDHGASMVCLGDPRYPTLLRHAPDPPWALNVWGSLEQLNAPTPLVSVIGSRKASSESLKSAFAMGANFAKAGTTVVSGGAYGCDIAAHHGVLSTCIIPAKAIVVLAGGLDHLYPSPNAQVFHEIVENGGAVISERLFGFRPRNFDFPIRNRVIAGLSSSLFVVSAGKRSGAMVTAQRALDYGRDVFVLQPTQGDIRHDGMRELLFDGAIGFDSAEDLYRKCPGYL